MSRVRLTPPDFIRPRRASTCRGKENTNASLVKHCCLHVELLFLLYVVVVPVFTKKNGSGFCLLALFFTQKNVNEKTVTPSNIIRTSAPTDAEAILLHGKSLACKHIIYGAVCSSLVKTWHISSAETCHTSSAFPALSNDFTAELKL